MISKIFIISIFILGTHAFAHESSSIKVGVALRGSPELNSFADPLNKGIEYAKEVFEKNNPHFKIELIHYPHKSGHDSVDQAAQKIIKDKVHFVIGGEMSDEAFALSENFEKQQILLFTPTASNPLLTAGKPAVFRGCFSDDQVAKQLAKYVMGLKNIHSIGVIHNTANAYSDYLTTSFLEKMEEDKNTKPIHEFRYASEEPNFQNAVQQFKTAQVDLVVAFTLQESLKSFHQLASKAGMAPLYLGTDGWGTNESLLKNMGNFHGIRNAYWHEESKLPAVLAFKAGFQKKFSAPPNAWNAIAYDSAYVLFEAISKAKEPRQIEEVIEILRKTHFKNSITANSIQFNLKNTIKRPLYLYEVKNNEIKFLKEVSE